jgi:serine/threonine protein kinase, bacterial
MTPEKLGSSYVLEERIGEGGLGVVWRGRDTSTGTTYAFKLLRAEYVQDPATVARFVRERTALLRFRHPNVVVLHDMIVERDRLALVMDLIAGGDLGAYRRRRGGTLPPDEATKLTAQICAALTAAHAAGIVHRDLKPANVLLDGDNGHEGEVRLTDFGIARVSGEPTVTTQGFFLGTVGYLAPEVIQGSEPTPACDVYAAGITLYELLAGQPPFTGQTAAVIYAHLQGEAPRPDGIPDAAWRLIVACLNKDPARRPSAAEVEFALRGSPREDSPRVATATSGWRAVEVPARDEAMVPAPVPAGMTSDTPAELAGFTDAASRIGLAASVPREAIPGEARPAGSEPAATAWSAPVPVPDTGVPGDQGKPRPPGRSGGFRRGIWAGGMLAVLVVAGAVAFAVTRSPGTNAPIATPAARLSVTALPAAKTGSAAAPGHVAPAGSAAASSRAVNGGAPSSPSPQPSAQQAATAGATKAAAGPSTATSAPANTPWQCGLPEAATIGSTNQDTGQTLKGCIRVYDGKLELEGTLTPTVASWGEQLKLVLKNQAQADIGDYTSPVCTTSDCVFTISVTPPSSGDWTMLPEWERSDGGYYESDGHEPEYVHF